MLLVLTGTGLAVFNLPEARLNDRRRRRGSSPSKSHPGAAVTSGLWCTGFIYSYPQLRYVTVTIQLLFQTSKNEDDLTDRRPEGGCQGDCVAAADADHLFQLKVKVKEKKKKFSFFFFFFLDEALIIKIKKKQKATSTSFIL